MNFLTQYSAYAVALITTVLGYAVGRWHQLFLERRSMLNLRFNNLYAPFEKLIWLHTHGAFLFTDLDENLQRDFFNLLFSNYEYADAKLKELLLRFKWAYDTPGAAPEEANKYFFMIEKQISAMFNYLSKKLFLEPYNFRKYSEKVSAEWDGLL